MYHSGWTTPGFGKQGTNVITSYHRPTDLAAAVELAAAPEAVILGGGTVVGAQRFAAPTTLVDLQDVGLAGVERTGDRISIGAMTRLTDVAEHADTPKVLADLARRELPRSLRNSATVGGTIASRNGDSQLLAGLLAFRAVVSTMTASGSEDLALRDLLAEPMPSGAIITRVTVDATGVAAAERTGRTPGDVPIVSAVASKTPEGGLSLALSGVGATPVAIDPADVADLDPSGDFRGSSDYRRHLARVLSSRVIDAVGGAA